jgi:uncharacterized membrane protein
MSWRIAYGFLRLYVGYRLLSLIGLPAVDAYQRLIRHELREDPQDRISRFIDHALSHNGLAITYFVAAHFLFWGAMDILLSYAMIRHRLWAFMVSIYLITAFLAYEVYRFSHTHSRILFAFILMDIFFVYLISRERRKLVARTAVLERREYDGDSR